MSRTTIRDIARASGLSTATVDRALNGRPGVRAANRQRVLSVARDLGYLPSEGMVILPSRPATLEFLIPAGAGDFLSDVARHIEALAADLPLVGQARVTRYGGIGPDGLLDALERVPLDAEGVGLVATDDPRSVAAVSAMSEAGVRTVTIASDLPAPARAAYVGVDNRAAGRTAAALVGMRLSGTAGDVALFLGSRDYHGHREREAGFAEVIATRHPHLTLLPPVETGETDARSRDAAARLLDRPVPPAAIYCIGGGQRGILDALAAAPLAPPPFVVLHDLTAHAARWLAGGRIGAVIDQNAEAIAEQAIIRLLGSIATGTPLVAARNIEPRIILRENLPAAP